MLHSFMGSPTDGSYPVGGVTIGTGGVLYGTTNSGGTDQVGPGCSATVGGSSCQGTIFSLAPPAAPTDAWTETLLYSVGEGAFADGFGYEAGVLIALKKRRALWGGTHRRDLPDAALWTWLRICFVVSLAVAWYEQHRRIKCLEKRLLPRMEIGSLTPILFT